MGFGILAVARRMQGEQDIPPIILRLRKLRTNSSYWFEIVAVVPSILVKRIVNFSA